MDSSAPTILPLQVQVPSTPSMLFSFIVFVLYLSFEKNENNQKEAGFGQTKKRDCINFPSDLGILIFANNPVFIKYLDWML